MVYVNLFGNLGNLLFQYGTAVSLGGGRAVGVTRDPKTIGQLKEYAEEHSMTMTQVIMEGIQLVYSK